MSLNDDYPVYNSPASEINVAKWFQLLLGGILILVGTGITLWLVWQIYAVITNPQSFDLIGALYPPEGDNYTILFRDGVGTTEMQFPAIFVQIFGYYVIARFLGIVVQIVNGMINNGNNLIQSSKHVSDGK